ncbi:MAG: T9SS type A sorting domain-containing protein [Paludibacter sp.]
MKLKLPKLPAIKFANAFSLTSSNLIAGSRKKIMLAMLLSLFVFGANAANRYWVGKGADTNWSTAANWASTSGGSDAVSVPGSSDVVYFDTNSKNPTVTVTGLTINVAQIQLVASSAQTVTLSGVATSITLSGNLTISAGCTLIDGRNTIAVAGSIAGTGTHTSSTANGINAAGTNGGLKLTGTVSGISISALASVGNIEFAGGSLNYPITMNGSGNVPFQTGCSFHVDAGAYVNLGQRPWTASGAGNYVTINGTVYTNVSGGLHGSTSVPFPTTNGPTIAFGASSVVYVGAATATIAGANYGTLIVNANPTSGTTAITLGRTGYTDFSFAGDLILNTNSSGTATATNIVATSTTISFNGSGTQNLVYNAAKSTSTATFPSLSVSGTNNTLKISSNTVSNISSFTATSLTVNSGCILDMSTIPLIVTTPSISGTLITGNTSTTPFTTGKAWGGTVQFNNTQNKATSYLNGSSVVYLNAADATIAAGQTVTGNGIPANTTVSSYSYNSSVVTKNLVTTGNNSLQTYLTVPDITNIAVGQIVSGTGIQPNTVVVAIPSSTIVVLSQPTSNATPGGNTITFSSAAVTLNNTATATGLNTLTFSTAGSQTVPVSTSFNNLVLNNSNGVTVSSDVTLTGNYTVGANTTVTNSGKAFFFTAATGDQTVTKTGGGIVYFDYLVVNKATSGNVVLSSSPATDIVINSTSGNVLEIKNTGGLDLNGRSLTLNNNGGNIYANGGARVITSSVAGASINFNQYKTISNTSGSLNIGSNVIVNLNANGNVNFGSSTTTINGTLSINSTTSCFVNTNSPLFGVGSKLVYNQGGGSGSVYGQSLEWPVTSSPSSVSLINNSWVQLQGDRTLTGDLTISSGALQGLGALRTITMGGTTQTITVSTTTGGAIYGTDNGTNNDLKLVVANGSTTTFTGDATTSADDEKKFLNITVNTGGTLALSRGILCKYGTFAVNGTLLINSNGYVQSASGVAASYSSGNLIYNNGGSYTSTDKEWPTTNYPTNVTIQNSGTNVALNNSKTVSGNLTISTGATLDLGAYTANRASTGGTLSVAGTLNLGGTSGGQTGSNFPTNFSTVTLTGGNVNYNAATGGQTIYAAPTYSTLTIGNTSGTQTLNDNLTTGGLAINTGGSLTVNAGKQLTVSTTMSNTGTLNLNSDANSTATILSPANITGTGTVNVQQYLATTATPANARNWYMSSPVSGAGGLPAVNNGGSLTFYSYSESDSRQAAGTTTPVVYAAGAVWSPVSSGTLATGTGYIIKPSANALTVTFAGTGLNTGDKTISGLTYSSANPKHGFNLIGNPFASYVNVLPSINANSSLEQTVWYRTIDNSNLYHCETVNATTGVGTNNSTTGRVTGYIPPMQAFWVRATVAADGNPQSITLLNANRSHTKTDVGVSGIPNIPTTPLKAPAAEKQVYTVLGLNVSNGTTSDETIVMFTPDATSGLDAYDSGKMSNGSASIPELYTVAENAQLAINTMGSIPYDTDIALGFSTGKAGNFSISVSMISNFAEGTQILLKDNIDPLHPVFTDLTSANYNFNSDITGGNTTRFSLVFKAPETATTINALENNKIQISVLQGNDIQLSGTVNAEKLIDVYDALGQKIYSKKFGQPTIRLGACFNAGIYVISLTTNGKTITQKLIVH